MSNAKIKLAFLCHARWHDNQAAPILRCKDYLQSKGTSLWVYVSPSSMENPEKFWPENVLKDEQQRREGLERITKICIEHSPDMILVHHRAITPTLLRCGIPLIVLEHTDAPGLEWSRYFLHCDNIVGVIKGTIFRRQENTWAGVPPPGAYNAACCEGMLHGTYLNETFGMRLRASQPPQIAHLEKIELGYSFGSFPNNKRLFDAEIPGKDIDISFVGQTVYPRSRLITKHRQVAVEEIQKLPNAICIADQRVPKDEFDDILLRSKICLSPLGYGACYRSSEGLYAGCLVLQPNCDYMQSWPDIYKSGETYIPCRYDFQDLAQQVDSLLDSWDTFEERRQANRELLGVYWDERLGKHLLEIIHRCKKRSL